MSRGWEKLPMSVQPKTCQAVLLVLLGAALAWPATRQRNPAKARADGTRCNFRLFPVRDVRYAPPMADVSQTTPSGRLSAQKSSKTETTGTAAPPLQQSPDRAVGPVPVAHLSCSRGRPGARHRHPPGTPELERTSKRRASQKLKTRSGIHSSAAGSGGNDGIWRL